MRIEIVAYILSCDERAEMRGQTIANLAATDWGAPPEVEIDRSDCERRQERQERTARRLLERACQREHDFVLFLEDDLEFNRHLRHNLERWPPLLEVLEVRAGGHFFGSLYNPTIRERLRRNESAYFIADPEAVYGSQAFLLSQATARYAVAHWEEVPGMQDIKMSRLAARVCPIYYHQPSLAQHVGRSSVWGGNYHWANDFNADWKA